MKMRIKYNYRYPGCMGMKGTVLYPYLLISMSEHDAKEKHVLHHERVHVQQIRRDGFLKFYGRYLFEWLWSIMKYHSFQKAYRNISYEKEAYAKQGTINLPTTLN